MALPETTVPKKPHRFQPGQSGNPAGRPKGARHKLGEAFLLALQQSFEEGGAEAIAVVRVEKPDQYLKVVASILPKELELSDDTVQNFVGVMFRGVNRTS